MDNQFYSYVYPTQFFSYPSYETQSFFMNCSNCQNFKQTEIQKTKAFKELTQKICQIQTKNEKLVKQNQSLMAKLALYEKNNDKKRIIRRRNETQLQKVKKCPYDQCQKSYASELALNMHMKLKHNGGTKTQRYQLAKKIILAQKKNLPTPVSNIVFPPNFLENFRLELVQKLNQYDQQSDLLCSEQNQ